MKKLISCKYHEDSQTVELLYTDGTLIDIDCMAVEDAVARNMYERSDLTMSYNIGSLILLRYCFLYIKYFTKNKKPRRLL